MPGRRKTVSMNPTSSSESKAHIPTPDPTAAHVPLVGSPPGSDLDASPEDLAELSRMLEMGGLRISCNASPDSQPEASTSTTIKIPPRSSRPTALDKGKGRAADHGTASPLETILETFHSPSYPATPPAPLAATLPTVTLSDSSPHLLQSWYGLLTLCNPD